MAGARTCRRWCATCATVSGSRCSSASRSSSIPPWAGCSRRPHRRSVSRSTCGCSSSPAPPLSTQAGPSSSPPGGRSETAFSIWRCLSCCRSARAISSVSARRSSFPVCNSTKPSQSCLSSFCSATGSRCAPAQARRKRSGHCSISRRRWPRSFAMAARWRSPLPRCRRARQSLYAPATRYRSTVRSSKVAH